MKLLWSCVVCLFAVLIMAPAHAVNPDERLDDPVLEERAREISKELRCLQCQNQSIDDSDAGYAKDMRLLVRERLVAGDSDREVVDFVVARYGEFALLRPEFSMQNLMLWLGPAALFLIASTVVGFRLFRRQPRPQTAERLSTDEAAAVERIIASRNGEDTKTSG